MNNFHHLHIHTSRGSLLDGLGKAEDYARRASELGMTHLAITDHGGVDNAIQFQNACKKYNIKPIQGIEMYIVPDITVKEKGEKRAHITLLAQNIFGWENILQMVSISNLEGFYYKPRIDPQILFKHSMGIVIMTACSQSFLTFPWGEQFLNQIFLHFNKNDVYLEVMPHDFDEQRDINKLCIDLSVRYGCGTVGSNDCHYVDEGDHRSHEVLLAVQTKHKWTDADRWKFKGEGYYLRTKREMVKAFRKQGAFTSDDIIFDILEKTDEIAKKCEGLELRKREISLPRISSIEKTSPEKLRELCEAGFVTKVMRKGLRERRYRKRMEEEIKQIVDSKFTEYFLIVHELIEWCKENDIMTGPARGSSAGSLVCYLLGITKVDPIEHGLLFARFLAPGRNDLPDIDMDFPDTKRQYIRKHLEQMYGQWNVAGISTFSVMRGRSAIRDVSRVFDLPLSEVNKACATIQTKLDGEEGSDSTISESFNLFEDGIAFKKKYPQIVETAILLEGVERQRGQHSAGVIISSEDLRNGGRCAYVLGKDKEPIINWDKDDAEYQGLIKLDVLGLNMLSILSKARDLIKENHNMNIIYEDLPLDNEKCYKEFSKGNVIGCFQLGSLGLRKFCQQLGVEDFKMLTHATSLYRPGPLRSGQAEQFVHRKHGLEEVPEQHPLIEKITKDTYGVFVYQEQIMQIVHEVAGLDWSVADKVRKIIAKSKGEEAFLQYQEQFVKGCLKKKTLSENEAICLWQDLSTAGSYSFNLSHAVSYSMVTYWDMYIKLYYPIEFICASLTYCAEDKREELIEEAIRLNIDIRSPKIGISKASEWGIKDNRLYAPFTVIKGVAEKTSDAFEKIGKEQFFESENKKKERKISQKYLDILQEICAYEDKEHSNEEYIKISDYLDISLVKDKLYKYKKFINLIGTKNRIFEVADIDLKVSDPNNKLYFGEIMELILKTDKDYVSAYCVFKDGSGTTNISFSKELYEKKKSQIEHCEGDFALIQANTKYRVGNLSAVNIWLSEDIKSANLDELHLCLMETANFKNRSISECTDCELRGECIAPVLPSPGTNVMIIGEAPGKDEDKTGIGFKGRAGEILWNEIGKYGYSRKDFYVSNFVKCYPSSTKTPTRKHINKCRKWLELEFERVKPYMVIAFGNTAIKFFTDEDSGITQKSGTIEWNEKYGFWICWSIHPASVLYEGSNKDVFEKSIEIFSNKVKNIGENPF